MEQSKQSVYDRVLMWVYGCSTSTICELHNVGPCVGLGIPTLVERNFWGRGGSLVLHGCGKKGRTRQY